MLGIPYDGNSGYLKGSSLAPSRIRLLERMGCVNPYSECGINILKGKTYQDCGDINLKRIEPRDCFNIIEKKISELIIGNDKLISIGGDHSITYPIISAFSKGYKNINILHLDAHADLRKLIHKNPYSHSSTFARIMEMGVINSLTQVGLRTLCEHQRQQIIDFKIEVVEMQNYNLTFLDNLKSPLYISIDVDVLDPAYAPGVNYLEPAGMTVRQLIRLIQAIDKEIIGADIVEYNPRRDINNMTALVCNKLIKELIAKMI